MRREAELDAQTQILLERLRGFVEDFWWILPNLAIAAVVLLLFLGAAALVRAAVARAFGRHGRPDLAALLAGFARWSVIVLGLLIVATIVFPSIQPADVLATLGVGSIAIGFAFKDILQNWLAGLLLLLRQSFRRGDQIVAGEYEGTVERIDARATVIRTYDGRLVIMPNSDLYTRSVIVNTAFEWRRDEIDVGIGYGDDIARACQTIRSAVAGVEGVAQQPEPEAFAWALAASSVTIRVRWWSKSDRLELVHLRGRVIERLRPALAAAAIDLPFPTSVVLFHDQTEATDGDRTRQREGWPAGDDPPPPRHLNRIAITRGSPEG